MLTLSFQILPQKSNKLLEQIKRREMDYRCANVRRSFRIANEDTTSECGLSAGAELLLHHFGDLIEPVGTQRSR